MNEKITSQAVAEALARQFKFPRRTAEIFLRAFADTIARGLAADGMVRVKGLGTFKAVSVESRESVSVSTGERITIPSFRKLSFTPDESVLDALGSPAAEGEDAPPADSPAAQPAPAVPQAEEAEARPEPAPAAEPAPGQPEAPAPEAVAETPADEFSAIDILITTPESLRETRQRLQSAEQEVEQAKSRLCGAQQDAEQARAAVAEAERLLQQRKQQLAAAQEGVGAAEAHLAEREAEAQRMQAVVRNIEANARPVLATPAAEPDKAGPAAAPSAAAGRAAAGQPMPSRRSAWADAGARRRRKKSGATVLVAVLVVLAAVGGYVFYSASQQQPPVVATPSVPAQPAPRRPTKYVIRKGDNLYYIARDFYGSKDSARLIIRANNFKDPNNVPIGSTIILP